MELVNEPEDFRCLIIKFSQLCRLLIENDVFFIRKTNYNKKLTTIVKILH